MGNKRSKIHHYVPKVLQRRFCDVDGRIWYSEKEENGGFSAPESRNVDSTFKIKDYYTILEGDKLSDKVEREFYGKIDNYLGDLLPSLLSAFDRREIPTFDEKPLADLKKVIFELIKRTPDFTGKHDDIETGREVVQATINAMRELGESSHKIQPYEEELNDTSKLKQYGRTVRVKATVRPYNKVHEALEEFVVRWAKIPTRHSFILSSQISYRIGNGGSNGLRNPNMEIWTPISPKIALVLLRDPQGRIPLFLDEAPHHVREVNEYAARNSRQIASHSMSLLESITGRKASK